VSVIEPAGRRRPGTATVAGYLMIVTAGLLVAISVVVFATAGPVVDAARAAYTAPPPKPDQVAAGVQLLFTIVAVIFLLVAVGQVLLGVFVLRGAKVARILTWVLNGLAVLCFGCVGALSLGRASTSNATGTPNQDGVDPVKFSNAVADAFPSWSGPAFGTLLAIIELGLIVTILLLALPSSHPFFRPGRGRDTDLTDLAYPAVPAYPPVPSEPTAPTAADSEPVVVPPEPAEPPVEPAEPAPAPPAEPAPAPPAEPAPPADPTSEPPPPSPPSEDKPRSE